MSKSLPDVERRMMPTTFEVRKSADTGAVGFSGYALKFDTRSENLGGFRETVAPGAVTKTVDEADVRALFNHDPNLILGRTLSGTLSLTVDEVGLRYDIANMPDTSYARDLAVSMERGDVTQSSFGFRVVKDSWSEDHDGFPLRTLQEIALFDVSPVTYPAYRDTDSGVSKRSLEAFAAYEAAKAEDDEETAKRNLPVFDLPVDPVAARAALAKSFASRNR